MNGETPRAGRVPTEDEFFGGQGTAGAVEAPGWMDNATRVVDLAQRTSESLGDGVTTVAFFAESHDAVVSRDVVLHEKRAIAAGTEAAASLKEFVSHVHRLRASDNQVVGCVAIEIDSLQVDLLRAYGVVASTSLANMTEHVRFTGGKGAAGFVLELYRVTRHAGTDVAIAIDVAVAPEGEDSYKDDVVVAWSGASSREIFRYMIQYRDDGKSLQHLLIPSAPPGQSGQIAPEFKVLVLGDTKPLVPDVLSIEVPIIAYLLGNDGGVINLPSHPLLRLIRTYLGVP
jgi:hypothetical protein